MNSDSYKIIISLSHHRITFEYWLRDGEKKLVPMPNGSWPAPLAFYCSPTGIIIGEDAARAAHSGTANAFENYFERLSTDETYKIGDQTRPIRNLLLDASETILRDFFRDVLFNRAGSLSDNRASMPLTLVCESDVKPEERALLYGLFKDSGYSNVSVEQYDFFIEKYIRDTLSKEYDCEKILVAWSEGKDLTFTLFDVFGRTSPRQSSYSNLGIDPRMDFVTGLIWERVSGQNPWLQFSDEKDAIDKVAADFLNSTKPMIKDTITLSDGVRYHYSLNRNNIDYLVGNEGTDIKDVLESFLNENGLNNRNHILLLLRGIAAGNSYFEMNLSRGFSKIIRSDAKLRQNTMNLLISGFMGSEIEDTRSNDISSSEKSPLGKNIFGGEKSFNSSFTSTFDTPSFFEKSNEINSNSDYFKEGFGKKLDNPAFEPKIQKGNETNPENIKRLEREWREIKATAKGKIRGGSYKEGLILLQDFSNKLKGLKGIDKIIGSVKEEISKVESDKPMNSSPKTSSKPSVIKDNPIDGSATRAKSPVKKENRVNFEPEVDFGERFVKEGKLKEARDWYRTQNKLAKAKTLTDIIRAQKGVATRKSTINECRKNKNREQINRIIKELEEYITLCSSAGVNAQEYKEVLSEYKKIK